MAQVGEFLVRGVEFALEVQAKSGKKLVDFLKALDEEENKAKIAALCAEVEKFAGNFPMPGH